MFILIASFCVLSSLIIKNENIVLLLLPYIHEHQRYNITHLVLVAYLLDFGVKVHRVSMSLLLALRLRT